MMVFRRYSISACNGSQVRVVNLENTGMKKTMSFLMISLLLSACCKTKEDYQLIAAKVIRYDCDRVVFRLLTDELIGDSTWLDVNSGQSYSNVVSCFNTCEIAAITGGAYSTLYVSMEKTEQPLPSGDCVQCQAIAKDPPGTKVVFTQISTEPCDNSPE
jgi:hypothetical protein